METEFMNDGLDEQVADNERRLGQPVEICQEPAGSRYGYLRESSWNQDGFYRITSTNGSAVRSIRRTTGRSNRTKFPL